MNTIATAYDAVNAAFYELKHMTEMEEMIIAKDRRGDDSSEHA